MSEPTAFRCPFCEFSATTRDSFVQASRLLAVHLVLTHPDYLDELLQHATDEWVARRSLAAPVADEPEDREL